MSQPLTLSRSRVATCILINLTATPGLGTLMCRRVWSGLGELALALAGFCLLVTWIFEIFYRSMMAQMEKPVPQAPADWLWKWGVLFFGTGWLWSLVTSISLWRQAKADEREARSRIPPRIQDISGGTSQK